MKIEVIRMKKKVISLIGILWACLCVVFVIIILKYNVKGIINSVFPPEEIQELNLTEEEKLEDFNFFFNTVTSSMPMINEYDSVYGFNITERKDYYQEMVKSTKNDYEFYCVMVALTQEIPSFHTDLVYPDSINTLHCYNSKKISTDRAVISYNRYWADIIEDNIDSTCNYYVFTYVDGEYLFNWIESTGVLEEETAQLIEIDGVAVDDFITSNISVYNLFYDGKNEKPCRTKIVLNDLNGDCKKVKIKFADGTVIEKQLCYSIYMEEAFLHQNTSNAVEYEDYTFYETDEYAYISLNNMSNPYGEDIKDKLNNLSCSNIIIDLRENYGGNTQYAAKYIYPSLFSKDIDEVSNWYLPDSDANKVIVNDWANRLVHKFNSVDESPYETENGIELLCSISEQNYRGGNENDKNVILITSQKTGSAADRFVSDMKKNNLALVVGNNTGGEGLMYSYNAMSLPNSRLVFIYMPSGAKNPDGSDNSVSGTKADVYINLSKEDFNTYNEMIESGEDYTSFEAKMKYDTILKYCVNLLEENK
jgi:hypothetical protein